MQKSILFLAHTGAAYGASQSLLLLLVGLRDLGWKVFVVVGEDGPFYPRLQELRIPAVLIPFDVCSHAPHQNGRWGVPHAAYSPMWWLKAFRRRCSNFKSIKRIVKWAKEKHCSVVYSNSILAGLASSVATDMKLPLVYHVREFGDLDYRLLPDLGWWEINKRLNKCQAIIYISQAVRDYYQSRGQGIRHERIVEVIYNGACGRNQIVTFRENALRRKRDGISNIRLGSLGTLHKTKGHDICIRGFAEARKKNPKLKLIIAGDGLELQHLRNLCECLKVLDEVDFMGYVDDVWKLYDTLDILLVASEAEAMGRVTAEAMAAALPVIGRNSGATAELIGQDVRGKLYDGTVNDMAAKIIELVQNPMHAQALGLAANQFAHDQLTTECYVGSVNKILERIIS